MRFFAVALAICLPVRAAIAIRDVTVVDVETAALRPHTTVVIDGDRIVSVGAPAPRGCRIVDGRGKFLIPGLWDMRVHLWYKQNQLPMFIAFGVTGVEDAGSDFARTSAWRDAIEKGLMTGPHIVTAGSPVDGRPSDDDKLPVLVARNPDEARRAFDRLYDMNVDFIEVMSGLSRESYLALAEQARHWHLRLAGPIPSSISAWDAIEARQRILEQLSGVMKTVSTDAEAIDFFGQAATRGVRISPALVLWQRMAHLDDQRLAHDPRLKFVPESIRKTWPELKDDGDSATYRRQMEGVYRLVSLATRTKVEVLAGTDTGDPYTIPGATLHDELEQLVAAGMTPHQALEAATVAPARLFEWDGAMGTVERGKLADLVLLNADPLADIRNTRKIAAVFSRGKYYSRKNLDAILAGANVDAPRRH